MWFLLTINDIFLRLLIADLIIVIEKPVLLMPFLLNHIFNSTMSIQQEAEEFQERLVKLTFLRVRLFWDGCGPIPDFVPDTEDSERRETLSALEFDLRYPTESHPADFTYQILFFQISC